MTINIEYLKKKINYRSNYRGTKEMDKLLGSFTKKYINILSDEELHHLCELLDYDDENLYKFNQGQETTIKISSNAVSKLFKKYIYTCE
jgi:antitoxin CptB